MWPKVTKFSLRTLLAFLLVASLGLAWVGGHARDHTLEQRAIFQLANAIEKDALSAQLFDAGGQLTRDDTTTISGKQFF